jgi:hypothetical protein
VYEEDWSTAATGAARCWRKVAEKYPQPGGADGYTELFFSLSRSGVWQGHEDGHYAGTREERRPSDGNSGQHQASPLQGSNRRRNKWFVAPDWRIVPTHRFTSR